MKFYLNNKLLFERNDVTNKIGLLELIEDSYGFPRSEFYLISNGRKIISDEFPDKTCNVYIVPRLKGGKGGFGSMLRAIGAQIEKTTNREACRDLSGRRLRDINEEQRLKNWINTQVEREKEATERKLKKLEKLCELPKHEFKDETYDKERSELPEQVEDAVLQGMQASCSTKRKIETEAPIKKKKRKLWVDDELGSDVSLSDDDDDCDENEGKDCNSIKKIEELSSTNKQEEKDVEAASSNN